MKPPALIGIAGKARSGKNTMANFIQAEYGGYQYSFAGPLRRMLKAGFGIDMDNNAYWQDNKETVIPAFGKSPRQMMQTLGTEWGRNLVNRGIWLILAQQELFNRGPGMIVTDVRFEDEAEWIRNHRGVVIHIDRPNAAQVSTHNSENGVLVGPGDIQVHNAGALEDLQFAVSKLFHGDS